MLATEGTWCGTKDAIHDWRGVLVSALVASVGLLLFVGVILVVRRWNGALTEPLPFLPLVMTAAALAAWAFSVRLRLRDRRITTIAAAVIVLFAIGCSAGSGRLADWLVWSVALAAPMLVPARSDRYAGRSGKSPEVMLQQLTRTRNAEGVESIRGTLVAEFAPAERLAVLYIAFCPPLERLPSVACEVVAGPRCDVKVAQIFHQGARVEVRLLRASMAAVQVKIGFVASERPPVTV